MMAGEDVGKDVVIAENLLFLMANVEIVVLYIDDVYFTHL